MTNVKKKRQLLKTVKKLDKKLGLPTEKDANYYLLSKHSKLVIAKSDEVIDLLVQSGKKQGVNRIKLEHIIKWLDNFKIKLPKKYPVEVLNQVKIPKSFTIDNLPDKLSIKNTSELVDPIVEALSGINLKQALSDHQDADNPIAVRLTDGRKFIESLTKEIFHAQQPAPAGLTQDEVDILIAIRDGIAGIGGTLPLINEWGTVTGIPATEATIATYTVPASKTLKLRGVFGEGGTDAIYTLYIDSAVIWQQRNAWTDRNVKSGVGADVVAGEVVTLKVTNQKGTNHTFTGGFYGDLLG